MRKLQAAAALVVLLLGTLAFGVSSSSTPAFAGPEPGAGPAMPGQPTGLLMLGVTPLSPVGLGSPGSGSEPGRVLLLCGPDGGTHPDASAACESLRDVAGEFADLPRVDETICTMEYAPVEVQARGRWEEPVAYRETFSNRCVASAETDAVFGF